MDGEIDWQVKAETAINEWSRMRKDLEAVLARAERAEAARAELHYILAKVHDRVDTDGLASPVWLYELIGQMRHALSSACGKDYVRREELEKLKARLDRLDAYPEEDENVQGFILDVLEQLEKRGVDTTNWDGDESSATIMAACVAGKIREKQEELDAAKAENARLRETVVEAISYLAIIRDWDEHCEDQWEDQGACASRCILKIQQALAGKEG